MSENFMMSAEEILNCINKLKVGDKVAIIRHSKKENCCDYIEGTIKNISKNSLMISFERLSNKRVKKSSIVSIKYVSE